jgi:hypothetical protein
LFPDSAIEAIIAIAGEPPLGPFTISIVSADRDEQVSGRAALQHHLENAARAFAMARGEQSRPTARQLEKEFSGIAATARRLLNRLRVGPDRDVDDMPTSLLSGGLLPFALKEAETSKRSTSDLLQDAVQGVERIARYANAARARQKQIAERQIPRSIRSLSILKSSDAGRLVPIFATATIARPKNPRRLKAGRRLRSVDALRCREPNRESVGIVRCASAKCVLELVTVTSRPHHSHPSGVSKR